MRLFVVALLVAGCGSKWTDSDARSATAAARSELALEHLCAGDGGCLPSHVRALERSAYCDNASMLARHGTPYPDAGIQCEP